MANTPKPPEPGYGIAKLMKRYIRKAESILFDPELDEAIVLLRSGWNSQFPKYRVDVRDNTALPITPRVPPRLWEDLQADFKCDPSQTLETPARVAMVGWKLRYFALEDYYWSVEDFPRVLRHGAPISAEFVTGCILHGPRALPGNLADYFPTRDQMLWLMVEEAMRWDAVVSIPFHPDMNEQDHRSIRTLFHKAVRQERDYQTSSGRIDQLRAQGLSDIAIAKRLGMTRQAVSERLRKK